MLFQIPAADATLASLGNLKYSRWRLRWLSK